MVGWFAFLGSKQDRVGIKGRYVLLVLWIGFIFLSSTDFAGRWAEELYSVLWGMLPDGPPGGMFTLFQKLFHIFLFVVLSWQLFRIPLAQPKKRILLCAVCCFTIGLLSEGLQVFFDTRHPSLFDAALNGLSGTLSSLLWARGQCSPPASLG